MSVLSTIKAVISFLVPRFVDEDVALMRDGKGEYLPVYPMTLIEPDEHFDGICLVRSFTWLVLHDQADWRGPTVA